MKIGSIYVDIKGNIEPFKKDIEAAKAAVTAGAGAIAAGFTAAAAGIAAATAITSQFREANALIQDQMGVSASKAKEFGAIAEQVYRSGVGESVDQASRTVVSALQMMDTANEATIAKIAQVSLQIEKTWGDETTKTIQAAATLADKFGISHQQAMDMVVSGYQRGLNASGDFLDSVLEYSVQFSDGGTSAAEFFSILESGMQGGVMGTDLAADAFKEFRVRIQDGSTLTADSLDAIGISSSEMAEKMKDGTISAADAFKLVKEKLKETEDQNLRMQAAVGLMGSQFENLGHTAALGIDMAAVSMDDLTGASERMTAQNETLGSITTQIVREIETLIKDVMDSGLFDWIQAGASITLENLRAMKQGFDFKKEAAESAEATITGFEYIIKGAALVGDAFRGWLMIWAAIKTGFYEYARDITDGMASIVRNAQSLASVFSKDLAGAIGQELQTWEKWQADWNNEVKNSQKELDTLASKDTLLERSGELIADIKTKMADYQKTTTETGDTADKVQKSISASTETTKNNIVKADQAIAKSSGDTAKKRLDDEKRLADDRKRILDKFQQDYEKSTLSETDYAKKQLGEKISAYQKAGADIVRLGEYQAVELKKIDDKLSAEKDKNLKEQADAYQKMYSDLGQYSGKFLDLEIQAAQEQARVFEKLTGDKVLAQQWLASETSRINDAVTQKEKEANAERTLASNDFLGGMKLGYDDLQAHQMTWAEAGKGIFSDFTSAATSTVSQSLMAVLKGDFDSLGGLWSGLWDSMLAKLIETVAQMAVEWAVVEGLGLVADMFHTGAWNIQSDEYPAILQKGEMVIPKDPADQIREAIATNDYSAIAEKIGGKLSGESGGGLMSVISLLENISDITSGDASIMTYLAATKDAYDTYELITNAIAAYDAAQAGYYSAATGELILSSTAASSAGTGAAASGSVSGIGNAISSASGVSAIIAAVIKLQQLASGDTDLVIQTGEGAEAVGDAFSADFFHEPWRDWVFDKTGTRFSAGAHVDAGIRAADWEMVFNQLPIAIHEWADPIGMTLNDVITDKLFGTTLGGVFSKEKEVREALKPQLASFFTPINMESYEANAGGNDQLALAANQYAQKAQMDLWDSTASIAALMPQEYVKAFGDALSYQMFRIGDSEPMIRSEHIESDLDAMYQVAKLKMIQSAAPVIKNFADLLSKQENNLDMSGIFSVSDELVINDTYYEQEGKLQEAIAAYDSFAAQAAAIISGASQLPGYAAGGIIDRLIPRGEDGLIPVQVGEGIVSRQGMNNLTRLNDGSFGDNKKIKSMLAAIHRAITEGKNMSVNIDLNGNSLNAHIEKIVVNREQRKNITGRLAYGV